LWSDHKGKILAVLSALALGLVVAGASVYSWVTSTQFEQLLADNVVAWIEQRTGLDVELANFDLEFRSQRLVLAGLVLRGEEDPTDPPLASVAAIRIVFSWRALVSRRVVLSSLEIVEPRFRLEIGDNADTNMPVPPAAPLIGSAPPFELEIGDFSIAEGELSFDEERVAIDFRLSDFGGDFDYAEDAGVLSGHIEYTGAIARERAPEIPYSLTADFDYTGGTALVEAMEIESGETALSMEGRIDRVLGDRSGALEYAGVVSIPFVNHFLPELELEGTAEVAGRLEFTTTGIGTEGSMTAGSLRFDRWTGTNVSSDYRYAFPERVLEATGFDADVLGGHAAGDIRLVHDRDPVRTELDVDFTNVDTLALRELYPWGAGYAIRSRARGTMTGWFDGAFGDFDLSGRATLTAMNVPEPSSGAAIDLRVSGSSAYRIRPRSAELEEFAGSLGRSRANGNALFEQDSFRVTVSAISEDLADLAFVYPEANGAGRFDGEIRGSYGQPEAVGTFEITDFQAIGKVVDRAAGDGSFTTTMARLDDVELSFGQSRIRLDGTWDNARRDPDLDVSIERLATDDLVGFLDLPIDGVISGDGRLDSLDPLEGGGNLRVAGLVFEGRRLGDAEAELEYAGTVVRVLGARLERDGVLISGDGIYTPGTGAVDARLEVRNHEIEDLHWLGVPEDVRGLIETGSFTVEGTVSSPLVSGTASIDEFRFREQDFGDAAVEVEHRNQRVLARITAGDQASAEVEIDTSADGFPYTGRARFTDYDAARFSGLRPETVLASGTAEFEGLLGDLSTLRGRGEVSALTAYLENDTLVIDRPFTFVFDTTRIGVVTLDVSNETTELLIEGTILLEPEVPLALTVDGRIDLALLEGPDVPFETRGSLTLSGNIDGTIDQPELSGIATLTDVSVSHPDILVGLTELNGDLFFNGDTINLSDLQGTVGGGTVTMRGNAAVDGFGPGLMDVRVDASNVRIRTPEGMRAVFDGAAALRGTPDAPTLEGNINVTSLSFAEGFEDFLTLFSAAGAPRPPGPLDSLGLALHVEGDENIRIENELVGVDVRMNLDVSGTAGEPALTGYVESTTGTLDLQGTRYRITRGNVSFIDPAGIDPIVDLQAETEIRNYRVILTITGRASDPRLDMRSDPALPQLEIISLIAGGRTREELAGGGNAAAAPTSEELFQSASATILTDLLAERVGTRFGLLNRVRIDPFLVGAESDPVARITISERITSNLEITYAQDLSSNRQQIILIEYLLDDGTSFIASRDETGAVGLDLQFRKRFR
jgi:hypothetical protein